MACGCQKNQAKADTSAAERSSRAAANQREAEARAQTSATRLAGTRAPVAQGGSQSFALRTSDGRTQSFGSRLERDAEAARASLTG